MSGPTRCAAAFTVPRSAAAADVQAELETQPEAFLALRNDSFRPSGEGPDWFDYQRRLLRNMYGPLGDPEDEPDWSLLW